MDAALGNAAFMLQCGHGSDAVENVTVSAPLSVPRLRFNAATAVTPWRTALLQRHMNALTQLQCGHGSDAVENIRSPRRVQ